MCEVFNMEVISNHHRVPPLVMNKYGTEKWISCINVHLYLFFLATAFASPFRNWKAWILLLLYRLWRLLILCWMNIVRGFFFRDAPANHWMVIHFTLISSFFWQFYFGHSVSRDIYFSMLLFSTLLLSTFYRRHYSGESDERLKYYKYLKDTSRQCLQFE
jgi:hypothetical protein